MNVGECARLALALVLAGSTTLAGCSHAAPQGATRAATNTLTQEQLAATNSENLYDAIAKLRPDWLTRRGPTSVSDATPASASVFMSGTLLGKVDYLAQMRVLDATAVRYWDAGTTSARFGMGHPRGVIEITRR